MANDNVAIQKFISSDFRADINDDLLNRLRALYRCQVTEVDAHLGTLVETLKECGLYEEALIIVASDHGEEFLEHGHLGHSQHLYDELIRVPLLVKLPAGGEDSDRVTGLVEYLDLAPTMLDVAGLDIPETMRGQSLVPAIERGYSDTEAIISEWDHHGERVASVRTTAWKYIDDRLRNQEKLYNLTSDPDETTDVLQEYPDVADRLRDTLTALPDNSPREAIPDLDEELSRRLRDLGYI